MLLAIFITGITYLGIALVVYSTGSMQGQHLQGTQVLHQRSREINEPIRGYVLTFFITVSFILIGKYNRD
ncbi:hypothetical protein cypCar_00034541 [Cyprinus carpio]|nr:hypothetical protein cypCar_00034541 [Cyprinus carpio]